MSKYLDPKADVVFKKIFAEHPHLLKSFLNAVLPLPAGHQIETLEYLPSELAPRIPIFKSSIVDVRCKDTKGQIFIVEMQIEWTTGFMQRMLFNASKAYIKQLNVGEEYHLLMPVYGLALLASEFDPNPDDWYHHYKMLNVQKPKSAIKDLQLVFVELPKFRTKNFTEKKLQILWLRFMSELDQNTKEVSSELLAIQEIKEAVQLSEEASYSKAELAAYDRYWDAVSVERTLKAGAYNEGMEKGEAIGIEKGTQIGEAALLIRLAQHRFGPLSKHDLERITQADAKILLLWGERVLDAKTLQDIFDV